MDATGWDDLQRRLEARDEVEAAARALASAQGVILLAVRKARATGLTWDQIGAAAGITRQAAWDRWRRKVPTQQR